MAEIIISTADGTIIDTEIVYVSGQPNEDNGLLNEDDGPVEINDESLGEPIIPDGAKPLYSTSGVPIFSTSSFPLYESIIEEATNLDGYNVLGEASITISWSGIDLDCCAYWSDNSAYKVGWSYSSGSLGNPDYRAWWTGDNTDAGPEKIALLVSPTRRCPAESSPYQFKVHLNYYGTGGGSATVSVTFGDVTLSTTITPATNAGDPATTSDPYVTITFAADGTPTSIN